MAPQTKPQWADLSELHHIMQVLQGIFVAFQHRLVRFTICHIDCESTYRCMRQALSEYLIPDLLSEKNSIENMQNPYCKAVGWISSSVLLIKARKKENKQMRDFEERKMRIRVNTKSRFSQIWVVGESIVSRTEHSRKTL